MIAAGASLDPLLAPRSIAVLGASERSALGRWIIESLQTLGYGGAIWPVNPKYGDVLGYPCFPSLVDLPAAPDVAAFCIARTGVHANLDLLARRGGRAAVVYDSGFAELGGEGLVAQTKMSELCAEAGIALCGPNCMGVLNPQARSSTFKQTVRATTGLAGSIGLVSQSGSICGSLLADLRRFGFSLVVSCGNEAVVAIADYIDYLVDDPHTRAIATFIESVRKPEQFVAALDKAADAGKPVIVLKVGRNERTRRAITSHTGGLAGESRVFSAVLRAHRAIEVSDLDELTEVLAACQGTKWPKGDRFDVLTTSGGQAELILDVATAAGLELAPLPEAIRARVEREVGHVTGDGNPLDAWGSGDVRASMPVALDALRQNAASDAIVFCSSDSTDDQPLGRVGRELTYSELLAEAARASDKPHYLMTMRPGVLHRGQIAQLAAVGVPVVCGARQGLQAIRRLARWSRGLRLRRPGALAAGALAPQDRRLIDEFESKKLLAAFGAPVVRERLTSTAEEALSAARELGFPVVLKIVSDDTPHKSEHGLVAVGLRDPAELETNLARMAQSARDLKASVRGWLVQDMIAEGVEVFAGVSRDPDFGLSLAFGLGGVAIETLRDFSIRVLPLREGDAEEMIGEIAGAALLGPIRARPPADVAALARCLYVLADFALAHERQVDEIDLNPIKVLPQGRGCVIVDALIVARRQG